MIFAEISALARILMPARGEALKQQLAARIAQVQQQLHKSPSAPLKVVYWFSSPRLKGDPGRRQ